MINQNLAEFAGAVQGIAYLTVLPFAARDLDGGRLYGATLGAGNLVTALVLALGAGITARFRPGRPWSWPPACTWSA